MKDGNLPTPGKTWSKADLLREIDDRLTEAEAHGWPWSAFVSTGIYRVDRAMMGTDTLIVTIHNPTPMELKITEGPLPGLAELNAVRGE